MCPKIVIGILRVFLECKKISKNFMNLFESISENIHCVKKNNFFFFEKFTLNKIPTNMGKWVKK